MQSKLILADALENILEGDNMEFGCAQLLHLLSKGLTLEGGEEIQTKEGVALSTSQAADCINDYYRTSQFLKGINEAITNRKNQKLKILYVGPGPFAPLLIPIISRYSSTDFDIIHFLEINPRSVEALEHTLKRFKLNWPHVQVINQNCFEFQTEEQYDIIICEAMYKGLTIEPQVALTKHLARFLKQDGLFIPEEISLYTTFSRFKNESSFGKQSNNYSERKSTQLIWTLQIPFKAFNHPWEKFPAFENGDGLNILTEIKVYGKHLINSGESLITDPICLLSDFNKSEQYRLKYLQNSSPKWIVELKNTKN